MGRRGSAYFLRVWVGCSASVGSLVPSLATAGGFYSPFQSATAIGTAMAGATVRSDDASFFLYNPAAIAEFDKAQTYFDIRGFGPRVRIVPTQAVSPAGTPVAGGGNSGNMADAAVAPGSVSVLPLGNGLTLGFGTSAPFATDIETDLAWDGRFHLLKSYMAGMNGTGAISWRAAPWLSIAAGVQVQRFEARFANAALIPVPLGPPVETRAALEGDDWGFGAVAGLVMTPAPGTKIGVSWRSAITHDIEGDTSTSIPGVGIEHVRFDVDLPQTLTVGLEQRVSDNLRVFADVQWVEWSRFTGFDISFASGRPNELSSIEWRDTWMAAVGVGYKVTTATELTAGISYDTSASTNGSGTTLSPDGEKILVGLGLIHQLPGNGKVSVSYGHLFFNDAPVFASSPRNGLLEGTVEASLDTVALGYTYNW